MAASLVQGNSQAGTAVLAFTSPVTAGNLLVVGSGCEGTVGTISDSLGNTWTLDAAVTGQLNNLTVWHAVANASGTCTVTVTTAAGFRTVALAEFSGMGTAATVDATATSYTNASPHTVSITNVAASCLLVAVVRAFHSAVTFSVVSGPTLISQANGSDATANEYQVVSTAAAWTLGFNTIGDAFSHDQVPIVAVSFSYADGGGGSPLQPVMQVIC